LIASRKIPVEYKKQVLNQLYKLFEEKRYNELRDRIAEELENIRKKLDDVHEKRRKVVNQLKKYDNSFSTAVMKEPETFSIVSSPKTIPQELLEEYNSLMKEIDVLEEELTALVVLMDRVEEEIRLSTLKLNLRFGKF
jgi:predicted  nucleic acid-binding Zn-ribbon protein